MQTPQITWDHLNLQLNRSPRSTGLRNSMPTKTKIEIGYKADQRDPIPSNEGPRKNSGNTNRQTSAKQNLEKLKQNRSQQIRSGQEKITRSGSANLGSSANSSSQPRAPLLQSAPRKRIQPKKIKKTVKKLVKIQLPPFITASNLATIMHVPLNDVFKKLEGLGFEDIRHNYILDRENAAMVAEW